jgi:hypothetical protein
LFGGTGNMPARTRQNRRQLAEFSTGPEERRFTIQGTLPVQY